MDLRATAPQIHPALHLVRLTLRFCCIDGYSLRAFDGLWTLRYPHGQDAILECGGNRAVIDISIERDLALEAAVEPLAVGPIAILGFQLLFPSHGEQAVLKQHFDIALLEA